MVFTGRSGASAGKGPIEQLGVGDQVGFHPSPVGKWTGAGATDLPGQEFDDAIMFAVVVRFDDAEFVPVAKSK